MISKVLYLILAALWEGWQTGSKMASLLWMVWSTLCHLTGNQTVSMVKRALFFFSFLFFFCFYNSLLFAFFFLFLKIMKAFSHIFSIFREEIWVLIGLPQIHLYFWIASFLEFFRPLKGERI